jgi:DNA invertase Pin-like site-specific DNA recombinase
MLSRIQKGEAAGIISWSPDRLARNSVDGGLVIHMIDTGDIADLQFCSGTFEPTSAGKLMLSVLFGMSKYYTDSLSDGIKRAQRQRIQSGHWPYRAPIGYLFDRNVRKVIVDPVRGPLIRKMFELYSTGDYTLERLKNIMTAAGLMNPPTKHRGNRPFQKGHYQQMLRQPFYTGMLRYHGELFEAKHQPLASQHLYDKCQQVMATRGRSQRKTLTPFLYRGMFTCGECGCAITMQVQKGHRYLHCTRAKGCCSQHQYIREEDVTKQILGAIEQFTLPLASIQNLMTEVNSKQKEIASSKAAQIRSDTAQIVELDAKLGRLTDIYVDGSIAVQQYQQKKEKLLQRKRKHAENIDALKSDPNSSLEPFTRFIRSLTEPQKVIDGTDVRQQRDFFEKVASNLQIKNKRVLWEPRGPWKYVEEMGRFAREHLATCSACAMKNAACPLRWSALSRNRTSLRDIQEFFLEHAGVVPFLESTGNRMHLKDKGASISF